MNNPETINKQKKSNFKPQISEETPIQYIKGVGPKKALLLERLGIRTLGDALYCLPWRYEDRKNLKKICHLNYGALETVAGEVVDVEIITTPRKGLKILELTLSDGTGVLKGKWFNQPFMKRYFKIGQKLILSGVVKGNPYSGIGFEMENPNFEALEKPTTGVVGGDDRYIHTSRIVPIYRATEGFTTRQIRTLMFDITNNYLNYIEDFLPEEIRNRNNLITLREAILETHFPERFQDMDALNRGVSPAHMRLIFDEFFLFELGLAFEKNGRIVEKGIAFKGTSTLINRFLEKLPFKLTKAQERVFEELKADMIRPIPMNRLIQGDVGCGKTVIALMSMLLAVDSGYQAALMAPTEILAEQHYINIHKMIEDLGCSIALLTGSSRIKPIDDISTGKINIVIGTHALIQEGISFKNLGLAIIDEQHRFGVMQRAGLRKKGFSPDIIVMTATPIPRTLALTLYGDLDISIIDELPAGRMPVRTKVFFQGQKEKIYEIMRQELSRGRQIYIVYPLIEGSEKLDLKCAVDGAEAFKKIFNRFRVGLIHGRLKREEREEIMASFKSGRIDILVSTTVIEVGVDVSNASLMLIVHAERFGLSQLHQLRGRVGRGPYESYCLLMAYPPFGEDARRRLKIMEATSDGFKLAEEDLSIRGPGEFFGTKQSGMPDLRVANILRDIKVLEQARREAFAFVEEKHNLTNYPLLKEALEKSRGFGTDRLDLVKS
ncbi:MAG: ATP-dependent DNA helicase RecG [Nitrospirae bacterium]|nr:ATP-dependent DNA helicase RecG [Nitrospirota bacterium]